MAEPVSQESPRRRDSLMTHHGGAQWLTEARQEQPILWRPASG